MKIEGHGSIEGETGLGTKAERAPDQPIETHDRYRHDAHRGGEDVKVPRSVAWLMAAPSPVVVRVWPRYFMYSATMLAFQAPPMAVIQPVSSWGRWRAK